MAEPDGIHHEDRNFQLSWADCELHPCQHVVVYLDGNRVQKCVRADAHLGKVAVVEEVYGAFGRVYATNNTVIQEGSVRIFCRDSHEWQMISKTPRPQGWKV